MNPGLSEKGDQLIEKSSLKPADPLNAAEDLMIGILAHNEEIAIGKRYLENNIVGQSEHRRFGLKLLNTEIIPFHKIYYSSNTRI